MMRGNAKPAVLSVAERCKSILAANCQAHLNTIKADAQGSKDDIHSSKIKFLFRKSRLYLWIKEGDLHNVNTIIDERGSLSVRSPIPGPLVGLLRSLNKLPARVALSGDVTRLRDEKVHGAFEILRQATDSEHKRISEASYSLASIVGSASESCRSMVEHFQDVLDEDDKFAVYKFTVRSCSYIDGNGEVHELEKDDIDASKVDGLAPLSEKLIDGINQSQARRRALMLLCLVHFNANARDALMLAVDRKGFDILAKVNTTGGVKGFSQYEWKEFRFTFLEEVPNVEAFCRLLVEMEEEALKYVKNFSGIS